MNINGSSFSKERSFISFSNSGQHGKLPPNAGEAQLDEQKLAKLEVGEFKSPLLYQILNASVVRTSFELVER